MSHFKGVYGCDCSKEPGKIDADAIIMINDETGQLSIVGADRISIENWQRIYDYLPVVVLMERDKLEKERRYGERL